MSAQSDSAPNPRQPGQLPEQFVPLTMKQKLHYGLLITFSWPALVASAAGAGVDQAIHSPKEWGQGAEGYGRRYASVLGWTLTSQTLDFSLETALHEDPRYFPLDTSSKKARIWHALRGTFVTRTDSGGTSFAYARVASAFATGQISRAWFPPSTNSFADGVQIGAISLGLTAAVNVLFEFVPRAQPKVVREP